MGDAVEVAFDAGNGGGVVREVVGLHARFTRGQGVVVHVVDEEAVLRPGPEAGADEVECRTAPTISVREALTWAWKSFMR